MDFITGDKFQNIADSCFCPLRRSEEDYCGLVNTFDISKLKDINLVYTHTGYAQDLFDNIKDTDAQFIVLTHNSDVNVSSGYIVPPNVKKWFTPNINTFNGILQSIPIGLENDRWFVGINKKQKMVSKLECVKDYKGILYINHNVNTNLEKRYGIYELFADKSWATIRKGVNGIGFDDYLDNIYHHKFVICPEGNGMDTHRTWECFYMGTIPIEKKNINNQYYTDLPICFVDEWSDITEEFLEDEFFRIKSSVWNLDKLLFSYWKDEILSCASEN